MEALAAAVSLLVHPLLWSPGWRDSSLLQGALERLRDGFTSGLASATRRLKPLLRQSDWPPGGLRQESVLRYEDGGREGRSKVEEEDPANGSLPAAVDGAASVKRHGGDTSSEALSVEDDLIAVVETFFMLDIL